METMKIKHICFLTWFLLSAFSVTNAIPKSDIKNLCRETADAAFCRNKLNTDPRIEAARDLGDVLVIAIQVNDAKTHINSVSGEYSGPNGRRRINVCNKNYDIALARFKAAWENALKKSFAEANRLTGVGNNAVNDCENGWGRGGQRQKSPLTLYNTNVTKLYGIIRLLTQKLGIRI
ncbi:PREDICTED: cell wall / vacuolar inhibitor of fructosidase 1-like [Brassica oleracea var. oleracea]|uniref:cell wall / vacuolar inhibitor of fructosidase 1-like n=1 Tax=Brassica oleracea var. oleracea TaxID=109376 RepID=UPI0006A6D6C6|nr:PREDICTED: cell wall / vacuolar inhibitor of fructosidase 1-like [Brassica oleracea var. oleracea]